MEAINNKFIKHIIRGNLPKVVELLQNGADIHFDNDLALLISCKLGNIGIVKILLEHSVMHRPNMPTKQESEEKMTQFKQLILSSEYDRTQQCDESEDEWNQWKQSILLRCPSEAKKFKIKCEQNWNRMDQSSGSVKRRCPIQLNYQDQLKCLNRLSVENNHQELVTCLFDIDSDVGTACNIITYALQLSSLNGHISIVKLLLENYGPVDDHLALHFSILNGHNKIALLLLENGTTGDAIALQLAIRFAPACSILFELLLECGASAHAHAHAPVSDTNNIALELAVKYAHLSIIKLLLENDANVHANDNAALISSIKCGNVEIFKLLLEYGANVNASAHNTKIFKRSLQSEYGTAICADNNIPLVLSIQHGNEEIFKLLLEHNADMHANASAALISAIQYDRIKMFKFLCEHGADIRANDDAALISSIVHNRIEIFKFLLEHGANICARNDVALLFSAKYNNFEMFTILLENGANVHACGRAAFGWGIHNNNLQIVRELLAYNIKINDIAWRLRWSIGRKHFDMTTILLEYATKQNINDALLYSIEVESTKVVAELLERGADVHFSCDIALRTSVAKENVQIVAMLLAAGANIYCDNKRILHDMEQSFRESLANAIIPYCDIDDYCFFPAHYIDDLINKKLISVQIN